MERFGKYASSFPRIPRKARDAVLERDHHRCIFVPCDEAIVDVHHLTWRSKGGQYTIDNLATLCPTHHREVHLHRYSPNVLKKLILVNDALFRLKQTGQKYPKRITRVNDPDLRAALKLYQENMPEDEQDNPRDIKRWIRECANQRRLADQLLELRHKFLELHNLQEILRDVPSINSNEDEIELVHRHARSLQRFANDPGSYERYVRKKIQRLEDYFWVHKKDGEIVGIVYYQYYYEYKHAFVGYLVSKDSNSTYELLARSILSQLRRQHPECVAIVGELDHPDFPEVVDPRKALARLDLLCRGWGIPVVCGAAYRQPKLALEGKSKETPLIMLYYPLRPMRGQTLSTGQFKKALDFVFDALYGDAFETQQINQEYRQYLVEVKLRILKESTYPVFLERLGPERVNLMRWLEQDGTIRGFD